MKDFLAGVGVGALILIGIITVTAIISFVV